MIYIVLKLEDGEWVEVKELGSFQTKEEANDRIFSSIENKNDFWTKYKVLPQNE
jgi:hypothetical protein